VAEIAASTGFELGDRVAMRGTHPWKGEAGTIINSPGKVFNGWTVRLDNGYHVGAADRQMMKLEARDAVA
jgi:hypothetical protein